MLLTPIMPTSAFPHDHRSFGERTIDIDGVKRPYFEQVFWAGLAGVSLLPATIVPTGPDAKGLPIGVQIIGPEYGDLATLEVAQILEQRGYSFRRRRATEQPFMQAIAEAHPNIALVKYWGKRDGPDNVPATPSLSITLSQLRTRTRVRVEPGNRDRIVTLNGNVVRDAKIEACLDRLTARAGERRAVAHRHRQQLPYRRRPRVIRVGLCRVVTAMKQALGLRMSEFDRSMEARRASASAARSLYGGFVTLSGGDDAATWIARPGTHADAWPLAVVVAICSEQPKAVSSGAGMLQSKSSPFYTRWTETAATDFTDARAALAARDFDRLGAIAEANCLAMHAVMLSARPALSYWTPATVACMARVRELRAAGEGVFFTIDAGPQVKAVCEPAAAERVRAALAQVPGVQDVVAVGLGGPAAIVADS